MECWDREGRTCVNDSGPQELDVTWYVTEHNWAEQQNNTKHKTCSFFYLCFFFWHILCVNTKNAILKKLDISWWSWQSRPLEEISGKFPRHGICSQTMAIQWSYSNILKCCSVDAWINFIYSIWHLSYTWNASETQVLDLDHTQAEKIALTVYYSFLSLNSLSQQGESEKAKWFLGVLWLKSSFPKGFCGHLWNI